MSTGSGSGGNTTVTQTNIPDWLQDPTKRMVARGEALTGPDATYQQYTGDRVAGFSPMQEQSFQGVSSMYSNPYASQQYGQAGQSLTNAQDIANSAALTGASYQPGAFQGASYNPAMQGATGYEAAQAQAAGPVGWDQFGAGAAQQYMSPYQQAVTDVAKQKAMLEGQQMMNKLGGVAAQNGAFGGSRFGLEQAQGLRDIGSNLSNIQVQGSQSAYDRAMQQFNADQQRRAAAEQFNAGNQQQANLANQAALNQAGMFGAGAMNTAAGANAAAQNAASQFGGQNYMTAQQMAEQSRQFGNDAGLRGADLAARTGLSAAGQYQGLGTAGQQSEMDRLNALAAAGAQQQGLSQKYADVGYGNFVDARDFDRNNLQFLSGLLRGNNYSTSQSIMQPTASTASQLGGLGLGALGAYRMFGG
jgi:hypothetical protein